MQCLQPLEAEGAADMRPTPDELAVIRELLSARDLRAALTKDLFADWVDAIAERTGTDPARDMYPRLVTAVVRAIGETAMEAYAYADPPVRLYRTPTSRLRRCRGRIARKVMPMTETQSPRCYLRCRPQWAHGGVRAGAWLACIPWCSSDCSRQATSRKANGMVAARWFDMLDMRGLYQRFTGSDDPPQPAYQWIFSGMSVPLFGVRDNPMYG